MFLVIRQKNVIWIQNLARNWQDLNLPSLAGSCFFIESWLPSQDSMLILQDETLSSFQFFFKVTKKIDLIFLSCLLFDKMFEIF